LATLELFRMALFTFLASQQFAHQIDTATEKRVSQESSQIYNLLRLYTATSSAKIDERKCNKNTAKAQPTTFRIIA
jgi:hypothetical protein